MRRRPTARSRTRTLGVLAKAVAPRTWSIPEDGRARCEARASDTTVRLEPVSMTKGKGPRPLSLPQPSSVVMREVARLLVADIVAPPSIASLAGLVDLGTRTLERHFRAETGLTPGRWQQHYRLLKGLEACAGGAMVKDASYKAGFATPSAYIAAFRSVFGTTPGQYFAAR